MAALAADAADDAPRASMIAAPRLATVGMKSLSSHCWSFTTSAAFLPPTWAWKMSGYCVAEWFPQMVSRVISETGAPVFFDSWLSARLWSRRVMAVKRSAGTSGACVWRDERVGVGRVADHKNAYVVGGSRVDRLSLRGEDAAVCLEQVAALHAGRARPAADEQRHVDAVEGGLDVSSHLDAGEQRERAVVELHRRARGRLERRLDLEQAQLDGHVGTQQLAGRDPEEQRVADLSGSAGDGDGDGLAGHGGLLT